MLSAEASDTGVSAARRPFSQNAYPRVQRPPEPLHSHDRLPRCDVSARRRRELVGTVANDLAQCHNAEDEVGP